MIELLARLNSIEEPSHRNRTQGSSSRVCASVNGRQSASGFGELLLPPWTKKWWGGRSENRSGRMAGLSRLHTTGTVGSY